MKITVDQNKGLTQHMSAEINPGSVSLIHFERKETGEGETAKVELTEKARINFPATSADEAYKVLEHFRWAAGKCLKAIKATKPDIDIAIKVAAPANAPAEDVQPAPGSPEEEKELQELIAAEGGTSKE